MADEKMKRDASDRRAKMYDKSPKMQDAKDKGAESKGEEKAVEKKMEGAADEAKGEKMAEHPMKAMRTRHEDERRDAHNGHKDMLRKMAERHDKEIADAMDALQTQGAPNAGSEGAGAEATLSSGAEGEPGAAAT